MAVIQTYLVCAFQSRYLQDRRTTISRCNQRNIQYIAFHPDLSWFISNTSIPTFPSHPPTTQSLIIPTHFQRYDFISPTSSHRERENLQHGNGKYISHCSVRYAWYGYSSFPGSIFFSTLWILPCGPAVYSQHFHLMHSTCSPANPPHTSRGRRFVCTYLMPVSGS